MQVFNVYLLKSQSNDTALFVETDPAASTGSTHRILHDKTAPGGLRHERTLESRPVRSAVLHCAKVGVTSAAAYPVAWEVVLGKLVRESVTRSRLLGPGDAGGWRGVENPFEARVGDGLKMAVWTLERVIPALEGAGVLVKVQPGWM